MQRYGMHREGCEWWGAEIDVLPYALVIDWVLSDSALAAWDNNGQQVSRISCPFLCTTLSQTHVFLNPMLRSQASEPRTSGVGLFPGSVRGPVSMTCGRCCMAKLPFPWLAAQDD